MAVLHPHYADIPLPLAVTVPIRSSIVDIPVCNDQSWYAHHPSTPPTTELPALDIPIVLLSQRWQCGVLRQWILESRCGGVMTLPGLLVLSIRSAWLQPFGPSKG